MKKIKHCLFLLFSFMILLKTYGQSNFYTIQLDSISGDKKIQMAQYSGKKILIVNVVPPDSTNQIFNDLVSLRSFFGDSLVVVAVPIATSNKNNKENDTLATKFKQNRSNKILVASKTIGSGAGKHQLYRWLSKKDENGMMDITAEVPGMKFLVSKEGKLVGVFPPVMKVNSEIIISAIQNCK